jgi:hypothetical protein
MNINYTFILPDKKEELIELRLDDKSLLLRNDIPEKPPFWTKLDFHQCPNCSLGSEQYPQCPVAVHYVTLLPIFENLMSHEKVDVSIFTTQRIIFKKVSAPKAVSSLMGLINATSGCPHTIFFRPMARFHLPFADSYETTYRVASMYLLTQYFLKQSGKEIDLDLDGLKQIYINIKMIDQGMLDRLRVVFGKYVFMDALTSLYGLAELIPIMIEGSLEVIRHLFDPYIDQISTSEGLSRKMQGSPLSI